MKSRTKEYYSEYYEQNKDAHNARAIKWQSENKDKAKDAIKKIEHQKGEKNSQYGTQWINNGEVNKKIQMMGITPTGWKLGRINLKKV